MISCHCHVFVAPRKLRIPSIATDGSRLFEQLEFVHFSFSWDGALGTRTTGRRASTQAKIVCRRKRLLSSEIRSVYNTKVIQCQIKNHE